MQEEGKSVMLITFILYAKCSISKASAKSEQLE